MGILGLDKYVDKSCTLLSDLNCHPLKIMKLSVSPIVRVAVSAANATDTQKLIDALKRLCKSDPLARYIQDAQTQETILCGAGELHIEVSLSSLRELAGIEIRSSPPVVQFCETVTDEGRVCLAKSNNKVSSFHSSGCFSFPAPEFQHNRVYVRAAPLSDNLTEELENGTLSMNMDANARVQRLAEHHSWHRDRARKIMSIAGSCLLIDGTVGIALSDIRDNVIASFNELVRAGPLSGENVRGVCFELLDAKV